MNQPIPDAVNCGPVGVLDEAREAAREIRGRIDQQLVAQRNRGEVTDDDRQVAAGGIAADRQPIGRAAKRSGVGVRPAGGGHGIVRAARERVLGRQAVVDAQHAMAAAVGQDAAEVVVGLEVAEHPAASVEEDQQAEIVAIVRPVQPRRDAVGIDIVRVVNRFGRGPQTVWRGSRAPAPACTSRAAVRRARPSCASSDSACGCRGTWRFWHDGTDAGRAVCSYGDRQ